MLYLNPPFPMINGVSLFPDHLDEHLFYYLPLAPKLTLRQDAASGARIPQIQLVKYRGEAGNGGFLNFDVNVGVEGEALDEIRRELKRMLRLRQTPVLSPAPLVDGTVKMMLFGKQSATGENGGDGDGDGDGDGGGDGPKFVVKIDQHAKPARDGNNQAAFSVALDQYGVTVLEQALQGEMSPIGVVYSLDYLALRPAYSVQMQVDWERVQTHLEESFSVDVVVFSSQIDDVVDKLIEEQVIRFDVDTFVLESDDPGVISRRDQWVNEVREMIIDGFFEPSLDPYQEKEDGWDRAADFFSRVSQAGARGGQGALFSYRRLDYTRIDRKSLNVKINERITVRRKIYPQGHLAGMFRILRDEGLDLDRFVIPADLDDPWFARRKLTAISRGDFLADGISSIKVNARYGDDTKSVRLAAAGEEKPLQWSSIVEGGAMRRELTARYKINFKDDAGGDRPLSLESAPQTLDGDFLEISGRELYTVAPIKIVADRMDWERYPAVEVQ